MDNRQKERKQKKSLDRNKRITDKRNCEIKVKREKGKMQIKTRTIKGQFKDWSKLEKRVNRLGWLVCSYMGLVGKFELFYIGSSFISIERASK